MLMITESRVELAEPDEQLLEEVEPGAEPSQVEEEPVSLADTLEEAEEPKEPKEPTLVATS